MEHFSCRRLVSEENRLCCFLQRNQCWLQSTSPSGQKCSSKEEAFAAGVARDIVPDDWLMMMMKNEVSMPSSDEESSPRKRQLGQINEFVERIKDFAKSTVKLYDLWKVR